MGGGTSNVAGTKVDVFDPCFIQTVDRGAENQILGSRILTSREIVITPEMSAPLAKAVPVTSTESLAVYGDVVRIHGILNNPGRTIRIFCRRLEFHPGPDGTGGIVVTGTRGKDGTAKNFAATAGRDGGQRPTEASLIPASARNGEDGADGTDGENGDVGGDGGRIEIYSNTFISLCKVALKADGGRGGNGAHGQQGGAAGNGLSGFVTTQERGWSDGGQGGVGGNGGDGGRGGNGGTITLYAMNFNPTDKANLVTISAMGGPGGDGAQAGKGGKGGNGGNAAPETSAFGGSGPLNFSSPPDRRYEHVYLDGANAGAGGICGVPGARGLWGFIGTVYLGLPVDVKAGSVGKFYLYFRWDSLFAPSSPEQNAILAAWMASANVVFQDERTWGREGEPFANPDERGQDGIPGKASEMFRGDKARFDGDSRKTGIYPGKDGIVARYTEKKRRPKIHPKETPDRPKKTDHKKIDYKDIAEQADTDQLKMLYEFTRTCSILTGAGVDFDSRRNMLETLVWLSLVSESKDTALHSSVLGTLDNLRQGWNIFGKDTEFAALGSLEAYKDDLTTMLGLFKPVEDAYVQLNQSLAAAKEQNTYLGNVINQQKSLLAKLKDTEKDLAGRIRAAAVAIDSFEDARKDTSDALQKSLVNLKADINSAIGLSAADFCNLFTQLSFTSVEPPNKPGGGELLEGFGVRSGAMILSQAGDMVTKALENVPSDLGTPINKQYAIRRMQSLSKDVKTIADFKKTRDGLIKTDPTAEYRLQVTREQLESLCSNFYTRFPAAKEVSATVDEYLETVAARNEKVTEYNQLLSDLCYVRGEWQRIIAQQTDAETARRKSVNPGFPALASFSSALRRHALERCIVQLYMASRVYTMQSLDSYDVFADVLAKLASKSQPGELDSAALNTALIDIIATNLDNKQKKRTTQVDYKPAGNHCTITLTRKKNPLLFKMLEDDKPGTFQLLPAGPDASIDRNPFARMSEVRITGIRCIAEGAKTADGILTCEITHPGVATFYKEDGTSIRLHHTPVTTPCQYDTKSSERPAFVVLDDDHRTIGPFCQWLISIPKTSNGAGLDLKGLESITVEFQGKYRAFALASGTGAVSGAGTGG